MSRKKTKSEIIAEFEAIHNNNFDYSNIEYKGMKEKINIKCNTCNEIFPQTPDNHKNKKQGCPFCCGQVVSQSQIIDRLKEKYHDKNYDYSKLIYVNAKAPLDIICPKHGLFSLSSNVLLRGRCKGCQKCVRANTIPYHTIETYRNKPTTLYYIKVNDVYKIGLTMKSVNERYSKEERKIITIIKEWFYEDGSEAFLLEKIILKSNKQFKYHGTPKLKSGNTELFSKDIIVEINQLF